MPDRVVALFGPTAVGKTAVAIELGRMLRERGENPVAISADALQVYSGLETLTGAVTAGERAQLEHRLVGFVPVSESFSVGDYMRLAHREIDAAMAAGRRPIVVGGTGLYLRAALAELSLRKAEPDEESELWSARTRYPTALFGLVLDRAELYGRIERRVEAIAATGGEREARAARQAGVSRTAEKALGFDELPAGDLDAMKRRSRNYAKRQLTWMRKLPDLHEIDMTGRSATEAAAEVLRVLDT